MKVGDRVKIKKGAIASDGFNINYPQSDRVIEEVQGYSCRLKGDINTWFWMSDLELEYQPKDEIVESIINQFKDRSSLGIKKYGVTLDREDLTTLDWMEHLKQELMDAILYIERTKKDLTNKNK